MNVLHMDFPCFFSSCLTDEGWLPFATEARYKAGPSHPFDPASAKEALQRGDSFDFCFSLGSAPPFGRLCVAPVCTDLIHGKRVTRTDCFTVTQIHSGYAGAACRPACAGMGREMIRRPVYFAYQNGYKYFRVAIRAPEICSFLFAHGFRSPLKIYPKWASTVASQKFKDAWNKRLKKDPDAAWPLARTRFGRMALRGVAHTMILDLSDAHQRSYAFRRLRLPQDHRP